MVASIGHPSLGSRRQNGIATLLALFVVAYLFWLSFSIRSLGTVSTGIVDSLDKASRGGGLQSTALTVLDENTPRPEVKAFDESRTKYPDGTLRFDRRRRAAYSEISEGADTITSAPETLFLVLTKDSKSWSKENEKSAPRTVHDMLNLIHSTGLDIGDTSIAIMTAARSEYDAIISATTQYEFARITVMLSRPDKELQAISGQDRHAGGVQRVRRGALARLRNYLMLSSLEREKHILWVDADVVHFSEGVVQTMIRQSETNTTAGIMTVLCRKPSNGNYDANAFRVNNPDWVQHEIAEEKFEEANSAYLAARKGVQYLIQQTGDDDLVELSSVGGTLLYMRASLVRLGLIFPWFNIIGTTWAGEGWMGLETEGICWAARFMDGGGCYTLGGSHVVTHAE
ncbi:hypothetical protein TI39_contig327g00003 [Zymoseptoria brevis]|uniref:Glycosyltransferase family 62 protein n=1 Tax=Zymoseptoria brevis TaxID=1047168 RepID=A0A0F4GWC8_9PEZI|nr:hypothetical protein TI39_contig327g00003 [Zymoseptoria brevis]